MFVILSGCSAVGKNTVMNILLSQKNSRYVLMPTYTTRDMRPGEREGFPYHYLTHEQFKEKIATQEMGVNPAFVKRSVNEGLEFVFDRPNEPTASGTGIHVVKKGEVASKIAARYGTTVKEMKKLNGPKNLAKLRIGDKIVVAKPEEDGNKKDPAKPAKLTVIVRDQRESVERIPPEVIKVSSGQMYAGKTYVISPGKAGKRRIKTAAVYENGVKKSTEVLEEEILTKPVPRQIAIGIKPRR